MQNAIPQPPRKFNLPPFGQKWFRWSEINACFWAGRRAARINPTLSPVREVGGVYLLAWSQQPPETILPADPAVKYVGETSLFGRRMGNFGKSAGFWGVPSDGHSAGWRWPPGKSECLWVAFFDVGNDLPPHLAEGMRVWMEAVAQEEHRLAHGDLPPLNRAGKTHIALSDVADVL